MRNFFFDIFLTARTIILRTFARLCHGGNNVTTEGRKKSE